MKRPQIVNAIMLHADFGHIDDIEERSKRTYLQPIIIDLDNIIFAEYREEHETIGTRIRLREPDMRVFTSLKIEDLNRILEDRPYEERNQ